MPKEHSRTQNSTALDAPCFVAATLFTSQMDELEARRLRWKKWIETKGTSLLKEQFKFGKIGWQGYAQGMVVRINRPLQKGDGYKPVVVKFPDGDNGLVPKGIVLRLDILEVLNQIDQVGCFTRDDAVYAFIDGSGAFEFESLTLILKALLADDAIDVAFGQRPKGKSGMPVWRKAIEEFEQYLMIRHWGEGLKNSYPDFDSSHGLLPDGQAGCWAFRLRAAKKLALTARSYEIELDLLLSAVDAGLRIAFSEPLLMSSATRTSEATGGSVSSGAPPLSNESVITLNEQQQTMHLTKLKFLKHKLGLSPSAFVEGKREFLRKFKNSLVKQLPSNYWRLVDALC